MDLSWKDASIDAYIAPLADILVTHSASGFKSIRLTALFLDGSERVSAVFFDEQDKKKGVFQFFDIVDELKKLLIPFHDAYAAQGEKFVAIRLTIDADGSFRIDYEYDDPYVWDTF
jgi:hypothetical protein